MTLENMSDFIQGLFNTREKLFDKILSHTITQKLPKNEPKLD